MIICKLCGMTLKRLGSHMEYHKRMSRNLDLEQKKAYWSKRQFWYDTLTKIANDVLPKGHVEKDWNFTDAECFVRHTSINRLFFIEDHDGTLLGVDMKRPTPVHNRKRHSFKTLQQLQHTITDHWTLDELQNLWLRKFWIKKIIHRHYDSILAHLWRPDGHFAKMMINNIDQVLSSATPA